MVFRGYGDDTQKMRESKRNNATRRMAIAASERASKRSANAQEAALTEKSREFDLSMEHSKEVSDANVSVENEKVAFNRETAAANASAQKENAAATAKYRASMLDFQKQQLDANTSDKQDARALKGDEFVENLSLAQRQMKLNEDTYAKLEEEHQRKEEARQEMQNVETAAQLAVYRAASLASGPLDISYCNALNDARGIAYGEPGSVTGVFPIIDQKTKERLGVGATKIGKDGNEIQTVLDPAWMIPKVMSSMSPEKAEAYRAQLSGGNKARGTDKFTAAALKYAQDQKLQFSKTDPGAYLDKLSTEEMTLESEVNPKSPKRGFKPDPKVVKQLAQVKRIKQNVLDRMEEASTPVEGDSNAHTPADNTAEIKDGMITVTYQGKTRTFTDGYAARKILKEYGITIQN